MSHRDIQIKISDSAMCKPKWVAKIKEFWQESKHESYILSWYVYHSKPVTQFVIIY